MIEIRVTDSVTTFVDDEDKDLLEGDWSANLNKTYSTPQYVIVLKQKNKLGIKGRVALHRIVASRMVSRPLTTKELVDHINGNTLDNRRSNLRLATVKENTRNQQINKKNTSGYKGVSWYRKDCKWIARIKVDGKTLYLGSFKNPEDAYAAYCEAAAKYHGAFARFK